MSMFWASCQNHGAVAPGNTYQDNLSALGPVGYWKLDDAAGVVASDSASGINGAYSGGFTLNQPPLIAVGTSVLMDGINGQITVPQTTAFNTPNYTYVGFFTGPTNILPGEFNALVAKATQQASTDREVIILIRGNDGVLRAGFSTSSGGTSFIGNTVVTDGLIHQFAFVKIAGAPNDSSELYIDGVLVDSATASGNGMTNTNNLLFGRFTDTPPINSYFDGPLDEFAFFNRALTSTEIADLYATRSNLI